MSLNQKNTTPAQRLPLSMNIDFRRSYARDEESGQLKNISLTGAFLKLPELNILPNDKLLLTLSVGGRERTITTTVIWKNKTGCGLKFNPFNNRDVQIVDDLMYFVQENRQSSRTLLNDIFKRVM